MSSLPEIPNDALGRSGPAAAYHWLTGLWLMLIGVSGSILLWLGLATAVMSQPASTDTVMARDDATPFWRGSAFPTTNTLLAKTRLNPRPECG